MNFDVSKKSTATNFSSYDKYIESYVLKYEKLAYKTGIKSDIDYLELKSFLHILFSSYSLKIKIYDSYYYDLFTDRTKFKNNIYYVINLIDRLLFINKNSNYTNDEYNYLIDYILILDKNEINKLKKSYVFRIIINLLSQKNKLKLFLEKKDGINKYNLLLYKYLYNIIFIMNSYDKDDIDKKVIFFKTIIDNFMEINKIKYIKTIHVMIAYFKDYCEENNKDKIVIFCNDIIKYILCDLNLINTIEFLDI